jgi:hypothetical protein
MALPIALPTPRRPWHERISPAALEYSAAELEFAAKLPRQRTEVVLTVPFRLQGRSFSVLMFTNYVYFQIDLKGRQ